MDKESRMQRIFNQESRIETAVDEEYKNKHYGQGIQNENIFSSRNQVNNILATSNLQYIL